MADFGILKARAGVTITDPTQSSQPAYIRANGVRYAGLEQEEQTPEGLDKEPICHWIDWVLDPLHSTPQALVKWIRQTAATVDPTMDKTDSIVERYCQAAVLQYESNAIVIDNVLLPYLLSEALLRTQKSYHLRPFLPLVISTTTVSSFYQLFQL